MRTGLLPGQAGFGQAPEYNYRYCTILSLEPEPALSRFMRSRPASAGCMGLKAWNVLCSCYPRLQQASLGQSAIFRESVDCLVAGIDLMRLPSGLANFSQGDC